MRRVGGTATAQVGSSKYHMWFRTFACLSPSRDSSEAALTRAHIIILSKIAFRIYRRAKLK